MNDKKTLTLNGLVLPNFILLVLSFLMILVGIYLTQHFFDLKFPTGLTDSKSLCDISEFWGCDKATQSSLGMILGVPTSIFGIIIGLIGMLTSIIGKESFERTAKVVFGANLFICIVLFIYSLFVLGSLCPMCTVYYLLSAMIFLLFFKYSTLPIGIDPKVSIIFLFIAIIPSASMSYYIGSKESEIESISKQYILQFNSLKDYGDPTIESPYKIHKTTDKFSDAPIRVTVFSDFQCPYCQAVSDQMPKLIKALDGKINIQYMFYPLDMACNKEMKNAGHASACQAAYLAACSEEKFVEVHDFIFENQSSISPTNLKDWEKKFNLENCFNNKKLKDIVQQTLQAGKQYNLRSTPTIIVNGKKLEGLVPTNNLIDILKSLVK